ncbi:hypothetical protein A3J20_06370 [Candidatus Gottesmanbacteria bacterium RIFCSPLOWO2_02_FULL_42_29]|uniref:Uncharacterized protein n=2 Tax=Candidatus Gottesmaniibacteriota TaxID=1752720 RepID=A0A1F6BH57_9BACT|nr:MAG: hypothetical protein UV09_C0001G0048 [Candidatus Gottesmanbacteria bacterium GW2011_GWA2_42_18]KKS76223.1 MAG: hypothetical protein UV46_C0006G0002 [Candidatus Gottesmanbacteria bacterium GW2011_GWC2_42_8]OGG11190.1 MAG: hypothetical protein A2781_05385 [Candidatus Gottesmanbacteria bacterium RIFCSPHIGHO2_01_FULL_42_27]OGG21278.1 MAG: hypothetical protein A3E72_05105 [Candidatus Gottesmanbacteria bacterium RIFCSPHIGHO2_12_FULL_43_26]OGG33653.1 MAG: hypothetical protein A3G68_02460 [Cand
MSEPLSLAEPKLNWWQRNVLGKEFIDFHKEPLALVADGENNKYKKLLKAIGKQEFTADSNFLQGALAQRKTLCEARLQAAKASKINKVRDERYNSEAELWYTDMALETIQGQHRDTRVFKAVTRSIVGEAIQLDREAVITRKAEMGQGIIGEVKFAQRLDNLVSFADNFSFQPSTT